MENRHFKPLFAFLIVAILFCSVSIAVETEKASLVVRTDKGTHKISRNIYGHFAEHLGNCIYKGVWVGPDSSIANTRGIRKDVVKALRDIKVPVVRWPGDCFADTYHWKDGIGPQEDRKPIINMWWGGEYEDNSFGTHEFMDFCEQVGCDAYISGNFESGTVEEMKDWSEYITFPGNSPMANLRRANGRQQPWKLAYFGIGNESWSCGETMTVEYYCDMYRRYKTFLRSYSGPIKIFASGPNEDDYIWEDKKLLSVSVSASKDESKKIHLAICKLDPQNRVALNCDFPGIKPKNVTARILTHDDINAHNTFDDPDVIKIKPFKSVKLKERKLTVTPPSKSVMALEVE